MQGTVDKLATGRSFASSKTHRNHRHHHRHHHRHIMSHGRDTQEPPGLLILEDLLELRNRQLPEARDVDLFPHLKTQTTGGTGEGRKLLSAFVWGSVPWPPDL